MAAARPKIHVRQGCMLPTWHPEIKYMDVSIENPECMQMQTSHHSEFIEAPNGCYKLRVIIKTDAAKETMSMHIGPDKDNEPRIIFSFRFHSQTVDHHPIVLNSAVKCNPGLGIGFINIMTMQDVRSKAEKFHSQQAQVLRPDQTPFELRVRITIRCVDPETWEKYSAAMSAEPERFLYLRNRRSFVDGEYPAPLGRTFSASECMESMLENADSDKGMVTFVVGQDAVRIPANSCVIQSRIGVPLIREGMGEASTKEIKLPHIPVEMFRVFLRYIYTRKLDENALRDYAIPLLELSNQYDVPDLKYTCEYYLCWATQNFPASVEIVKTLEAAENFHAHALKKACFATIFTYGQHLLKDPAFLELSQPLLLEMLCDFAERRVVHMPGVPTVPPGFPPLEETNNNTQERKKRRS